MEEKTQSVNNVHLKAENLEENKIILILFFNVIFSISFDIRMVTQ